MLRERDRLITQAVRLDMAAEERRRSDLRAVADTPAGRRVLAALVSDDRALMGEPNGNSSDMYRLGRHRVAVELREELKRVLPREVFISIVFPREEIEP